VTSLIRRLLLIPVWVFLLASPAFGGSDPAPTFVGPTEILLVKADSVYLVRSLQWNSAAVPNREKLLLHGIRMRFWRDHLPSDMREVYDVLGYPVGRTLLTPVGHSEEWWYYGLLDPPLRFRDGVLLDWDRFEDYVDR
jgi:hypothetical protein